MTSRRVSVFQECREQATLLAQQHEALKLCAADLDYCATDDRFQIAVRQMQDARPGLPGAASYEGKTSIGGRSDSVPERLLLTPDPGAADRALLDRLLRTLAYALNHDQHQRATTAAKTLWNLVNANCTRPASDLDRRKALEENRKLEGCQHHQTANIFEPVYKAATTVAGRVQPPMDLCEPCYDHVRRYDKLPSGEWIDRRQRTGKSEGERVTVRGKVKA